MIAYDIPEDKLTGAIDIPLGEDLLAYQYVGGGIRIVLAIHYDLLTKQHTAQGISIKKLQQEIRDQVATIGRLERLLDAGIDMKGMVLPK